MKDFDFIAKSMVAEKLLAERISGSISRAAMSRLAETRFVGRSHGRAYCPRCKHEVELLSFAAARLMFAIDQEAIDARTRSCELHRLHNRNGLMMICSKSLVESFAIGGHHPVVAATV